MLKQSNYEGKVLTWEDRGSGQPVVLLHGFGEDRTVWEGQVRSLQKEFRVLLPDLPGTGASEAIPDMSMEGLAKAVRFMLLESGVERCTLIGHSMGGYVTLAFVDQYQGMVESFGLFHSTSFADGEEKKEARRKGIAFIEANGASSFLKSTTPNLFHSDTRAGKAELVAAQLEGAHNFSGATLVSYYRSMMERPDRTHLLREAGVPVLFVIGQGDTAVKPEEALKQCTVPDLSYIHILVKSGHMGMKEQPDESTILIRRFLMKTT